MNEKITEQYFAGKSVAETKTAIMRDIFEQKLTGTELADVIAELSQRQLLINKPFEKISREHWNVDYAQELRRGAISDHFSKDYLEYFAEVVEYVRKPKSVCTSGNKRNWKCIAVIAGVIVVLVVLITVLARLRVVGDK